MHGAVLVFSQQVEPTRLMMTDVALLLQPLQACIVGVQLEGLVEEIGPQNLEPVHHRQQLKHSGWVNLWDSTGTGWNAPAPSGCSSEADTASSEASVSRRVGRAGSHLRSGCNRRVTSFFADLPAPGRVLPV